MVGKRCIAGAMMLLESLRVARLAETPVPLQGGCRRPQNTLSPFLCERPVSSAGFPHYQTGWERVSWVGTGPGGRADPLSTQAPDPGVQSGGVSLVCR